MIDTAKNKVTDYKVVLTTEVAAAIKDGWLVYGNPFYGTSTKSFQAVVKVVPTSVGIAYS